MALSSVLAGASPRRVLSQKRFRGGGQELLGKVALVTGLVTVPKSKALGLNPDINYGINTPIIFVSLRHCSKVLECIEQDANICYYYSAAVFLQARRLAVHQKALGL